MFYTIYKVTNNINGKFYIGKHQTKNLQDGYMGSGKLIKDAIKKYGIENFTKEILHIFKTEEEMNQAEKDLVVLSEISYNICEGGKGGWSFVNRTGLNTKITEKVIDGREITRQKQIGRKNHLSSENLKKAHQAGKINYATFTGRKHSEETKKRIAESRKKYILEHGTQYK